MGQWVFADKFWGCRIMMIEDLWFLYVHDLKIEATLAKKDCLGGAFGIGERVMNWCNGRRWNERIESDENDAQIVNQ